MSSKSYDDVAWAISTQIWEDWLDLLRTDADIYNDIGIILSEEFKDLEWESFEYLMTGGFNTCFKMNFANSFGAIIRFPLPGAVMFPAEKVCNEVSAMRFILDKSSDKMPIPVPFVFRAAETKESPSDMGPFIIMSYVPHSKSMADLLEAPEREAGQPPVLNPGLEQVRLERLFRKLAKIVLSLSTLSFDRIGSLHRNDNSTWEVLSRPLSYSMSEIVQLGTLPRSKLPTTMFKKAWSYFEALAELHISHLMTKRNEDSIEADIDNDLLADIFRRKFVARFLFRKLVRDVEQRKQWLMYENGPFPVWCDDFRPENVLADQAENIVGVVDWEFTYTAPVELHMRRLGGFFLRSQKIGRAVWINGVLSMRKRFRRFSRQCGNARTRQSRRDTWWKATDCLVGCETVGRPGTFGSCMLQETILRSTRCIGKRLISGSLGRYRTQTTMFGMYGRRDCIFWKLERRGLWRSMWI